MTSPCTGSPMGHRCRSTACRCRWTQRPGRGASRLRCPPGQKAWSPQAIPAGPVELLARVNGTDFRVFAEGISRERAFGDASIRVSGRGRNAVLAAPYAPVLPFTNTESRTAHQLMDDVLTVNGIPLGWTVDWGLTDWNVPAGAFAHQGTWIEALTTIASAAGGYLVPHPSNQSSGAAPLPGGALGVGDGHAGLRAPGGRRVPRVAAVGRTSPPTTGSSCRARTPGCWAR